jgi:hypothetical protein
VPFSLSAVAPLPCRMPLPALRLESHGWQVLCEGVV